MIEPLDILIIEDRNADFLMVVRHLKHHGLPVRCSRVDSFEGLKEAVVRENWDLVLSDYDVPQLDFHDSLALILAALPETPVIMVTGTVGEERAVELLRLGVWDFVLKDNLARLVPVIERSLKDVAELRAKRLAKETLSESNDRFRMIFEHSIDAILLTRVDGSILAANPEACRVFGMSEAQIRTVGREGLVDAEDARVLELQETLRCDGRCSGEITMMRGDGSRFPADTSSAEFTCRDGLRKISMIIRDVTQQKKLEEFYRQSQKMEAVGQLAGGVAHDFNNILSIISGFSHMILDTVQETDPVRNHTEQILKASSRAAVLTQSLLAFSRKQPVTLAVIDLSELVTGFDAFFRKLIREDIELTVNCTAESLNILADRGQIEQVMMNLVTNARDAMPDSGRLSMETLSVTLDQEFIEAHGYGKVGAYALFMISDDGAGMDMDTQSRIFEPFFTTKEQGKGTGLGLSMAYGVVKKHDGFIEVCSEPGTGTTFKIYLPLVSAAAQADKKQPRDPAAFPGGAETILVCEDDEDLRRLTVKVLNRFGYRVLEAVDGEDAVEKFAVHKDKVDLVILDAIMPKKNGNLASQEMRRLRPALKTIFASGYAWDVFDNVNPSDENTIFINKPILPKELLAKVREMLDK